MVYVSHTKMSRGLGSPHPSPFFLKIIYSVTCRKKKDYFRHADVTASVMMLLSEEQDGSLPTHFFEQEKNRHFYLSLCVFSLLLLGEEDIIFSWLFWPRLAYRVPKILLFSFKVSPSFRQRAECNLAVCNQVPSVQEFARLAISP